MKTAIISTVIAMTASTAMASDLIVLPDAEIDTKANNNLMTADEISSYHATGDFDGYIGSNGLRPFSKVDLADQRNSYFAKWSAAQDTANNFKKEVGFLTTEVSELSDQVEDLQATVDYQEAAMLNAWHADGSDHTAPEESPQNVDVSIEEWGGDGYKMYVNLSSAYNEEILGTIVYDKYGNVEEYKKQVFTHGNLDGLAAEVESIIDLSYSEGYEDGYADGFQDGMQYIKDKLHNN